MFCTSLKKLLFGRTALNIKFLKNDRSSIYKIPKAVGQERAVEIEYRVDDGLLTTLILNINKLEIKVRELEEVIENLKSSKPKK